MDLPYKLSHFLWQTFRIPEPLLTEANISDQSGRVCLITGGYAGVGFEVSSILFEKNATVYIAGRSESKGLDALERIRNTYPQSTGRIDFLKVDLADLATIKPMVDDFMRRETKLHWLNNNAGVMQAPVDVKGAQKMNVQFQTNIYGPFLLTKLLLPVLRRTAVDERPGSVRVTWAGSLGTILSPYPGGVAWNDDGTALAGEESPGNAYSITKAANYLLGAEFGKRSGNHDGVLHLTYNPGNLRTELARHITFGAAMELLGKAITYPPRFGAYTELYAGLSTQLDIEQDQGRWVVPWGRKDMPMRADIVAETQKAKGMSVQIYDWCDGITRDWQ